MNKTQLIEAVAEKLSVSKKESGEIISTVIGTIVEATKNDGECVIPGLGKLKQVDVGARSGTSMGKSWSKPAHKTLKLRLSKEAKE